MNVHEYVATYMNYIGEVLKRLYVDYDENCQRSIFLLGQEEELAYQDYFTFEADNRCKPDRKFLMDRVNRFGVNRADLFNENERSISKEDFVSVHLDMVNDGAILKKHHFLDEDYDFILKRERFLAEKKFDEKLCRSKGYEELDIQKSKKTQELILYALKCRFEKDVKDFYLGMKRKD